MGAHFACTEGDGFESHCFHLKLALQLKCDPRYYMAWILHLQKTEGLELEF